MHQTYPLFIIIIIHRHRRRVFSQRISSTFRPAERDTWPNSKEYRHDKLDRTQLERTHEHTNTYMYGINSKFRYYVDLKTCACHSYSYTCVYLYFSKQFSKRFRVFGNYIFMMTLNGDSARINFLRMHTTTNLRLHISPPK